MRDEATVMAAINAAVMELGVLVSNHRVATDRVHDRLRELGDELTQARLAAAQAEVQRMASAIANETKEG